MSIWKRNVGTPENPVSYLHEYAIALIWDRLEFGKCEVKTDSGQYERVSVPPGGRIAIPDELTAIGGMMPDIAIYNAEHRPVAIVEVQVTAVPSDRKIARMRKLGVQMFVVPVPNQEALRNMLCPVSTQDVLPDMQLPCRYYGHSTLIIKRLWNKVFTRKDRRRLDFFRQNLDEANESVAELIRSLRMCDPTLRQELRSVLDTLDSVESIYPILPDNPKAQVLRKLREPHRGLKVIK